MLTFPCGRGEAPRPCWGHTEMRLRRCRARALPRSARMPERHALFAFQLAIPFAAALTVSGCSGVVTIVEPAHSGPVAPAPTMRVQLGSNYVGAYQAELDGAPITGLFTPAPAAGTTVTANMPGCYEP